MYGARGIRVYVYTCLYLYTLAAADLKLDGHREAPIEIYARARAPTRVSVRGIKHFSLRACAARFGSSLRPVD